LSSTGKTLASGSLFGGREHFLDNGGDLVVGRSVVHNAGTERKLTAQSRVRQIHASSANDLPQDGDVAVNTGLVRPSAP